MFTVVANKELGGGDEMSLYDTFGIYGIRNKINGNVYVGKTGNNFGDRRDCHLASLRGGYGVNAHLQRAWNKYGEDNFEFFVIKECDKTDNLGELEKAYIRKYRETGTCYNIADGGEGGGLLGAHLTDDAKRRIGEKNRVNMTGRKASEETKRKMSVSQRNRFAGMSDDERSAYGKMMSEVASGYTWSEEAKKRFSEQQRMKPNGAKYTIDQVREIRRLHEKEGLGYSDIARIMKIDRHCVYLIATYRRWKNIE